MPKKRGLGSASPEVRKAVSTLGGEASHPHGRGLQNIDPAERLKISRKGWLTSRAVRKRKKELKWVQNV